MLLSLLPEKELRSVNAVLMRLLFPSRPPKKWLRSCQTKKKQGIDREPVEKTATVPQASADKPVDTDPSVWDLLKPQPNKAAKETSADKPADTATGSDLDEHDFNSKGISHEDVEEDEPLVEIEPSPTPLADNFFKKVSTSIDEETNANDQSLQEIAADFLWTGSYLQNSIGETIPYANTDRLEKLLSETARVRNKYHNRLFLENTLEDLDTERDLEKSEAVEIPQRLFKRR